MLTKSPSGSLSPYYYKGGYIYGLMQISSRILIVSE